MAATPAFRVHRRSELIPIIPSQLVHSLRGTACEGVLALKQWAKHHRRWLGGGACALVLIGVTFSVPIFAPTMRGAPVLVSIAQGSSAEQIAAELKESGLVRNSFAFVLAARWYGKTYALQAGTYELAPGMNLREILVRLSQGRVANTAIRVTIPEGLTLPQVGLIFADHGMFSQADFLAAVVGISLPYAYLDHIPSTTVHRLEGYLFPDTYEFHLDASPEFVIRTMAARFNAVVPPLFAESPKREHYSLHQIVTMASMVEREAVKHEERSRIAGVFYNRLQRGMLLQSCATVQFVTGRVGRILYIDLEVDSLYNTYRHAGLPPGPIANPGLASLRAALTPEGTDYLFFVARDDGSHIFSRTYAEHRVAIQRATRR